MNALPGAARPHRPLGAWWALLGLVLALFAALFGAQWDTRLFDSSDARARALERLWQWLSALATPDLSIAFLSRAWDLTLQTLSVAILGTVLGVVGAHLLALASSRAVLAGTRGGAWRHLVCALARLLQDVLRAVPDFVWAIIFVTAVGLGPLAGLIAIAVNMTGTLAKVYSELWDNVAPQRYESVSALDARRLVVFAHAIRPLAARSALSFTLMRWECAVRNAAVIGVVGGGGLGAEIVYQIRFGAWDQVSTLILFTLALTWLVDLGSNHLRRQLRDEADQHASRSPRVAVLRAYGAVVLILGAVLAASALLIWGHAADGSARNHLAPVLELFTGNTLGQLAFFERLLHPDLRFEVLLPALRSAVDPLAMALVATLASAVLAALLGYFCSRSFQLQASRFIGGARSRWQRLPRRLWLVAGRGLALVLRGIPEVTWALLLIAFFGPGLVAGTVALTLHSTGLLLRVFAEAVDNLPHRLLEPHAQGTPLRSYVLVAAPLVWREWLTYVFFQFEANVRMAVVLGLVGVGGLGFQFAHRFEFFRFEQASTYLLVMIALTLVIDRLARSLKLSRNC